MVVIGLPCEEDCKKCHVECTPDHALGGGCCTDPPAEMDITLPSNFTGVTYLPGGCSISGPCTSLNGATFTAANNFTFVDPSWWDVTWFSTFFTPTGDLPKTPNNYAWFYEDFNAFTYSGENVAMLLGLALLCNPLLNVDGVTAGRCGWLATLFLRAYPLNIGANAWYWGKNYANGDDLGCLSLPSTVAAFGTSTIHNHSCGFSFDPVNGLCGPNSGLGNLLFQPH